MLPGPPARYTTGSDFARAERGKGAYEFAEGDVGDAVSKAVAVYRYTSPQQPARYVGAYLPKRHQPNPTAGRLLAALRTHAASVVSGFSDIE